MSSLFEQVQACILSTEPAAKVALTQQTLADWRAGKLLLESVHPVLAIGEPGRPPQLQLVAPRDLKKRGLGTREGHAALLHAIAHIEFNAINLALDAVYRFREMPRAYYDEWLLVAGEEAYHFSLLQERLASIGCAYGDFPAHDGLWQAARDTADDVLIRMALVPRVLEARGLDVTPGIIERLKAHGDSETVAILEIILRDEVGHVEIGSRWFHYVCDERGLDREQTFKNLMSEHMRGRIKGPLHAVARRKAGFSENELSYLESLIQAAG